MALLFAHLPHEERPGKERGDPQEVHGEENQGGGKVSIKKYDKVIEFHPNWMYFLMSFITCVVAFIQFKSELFFLSGVGSTLTALLFCIFLNSGDYTSYYVKREAGK